MRYCSKRKLVNCTAIGWEKIEANPNKEIKVLGSLLLDFRAKINSQIIEINNLRMENENLQDMNRSLQANLKQLSIAKEAKIK